MRGIGVADNFLLSRHFIVGRAWDRLHDDRGRTDLDQLRAEMRGDRAFLDAVFDFSGHSGLRSVFTTLR